RQQREADAAPAGAFLSREEVAARPDGAVQSLAEQSTEFADLLRRRLPEFVIVPVQALDTPQVRPRARVTLSLRAWAAEGEPAPEASAELDLFEPPAHIRH